MHVLAPRYCKGFRTAWGPLSCAESPSATDPRRSRTRGQLGQRPQELLKIESDQNSSRQSRTLSAVTIRQFQKRCQKLRSVSNRVKSDLQQLTGEKHAGKIQMAWYVRRAFADPIVYLGNALRTLPREMPLLPEKVGMPRMLWQRCFSSTGSWRVQNRSGQVQPKVQIASLDGHWPTAVFLAGYGGYEKFCSETFLGFGTNKAAGQYWNVTRNKQWLGPASHVDNSFGSGVEVATCSFLTAESSKSTRCVLNGKQGRLKERDTKDTMGTRSPWFFWHNDNVVQSSMRMTPKQRQNQKLFFKKQLWSYDSPSNHPNQITASNITGRPNKPLQEESRRRKGTNKSMEPQVDVTYEAQRIFPADVWEPIFESISIIITTCFFVCKSRLSMISIY